MTKISPPERIYLQTSGEKVESVLYETGDITWCADQINDDDTLYIRSDVHNDVRSMNGELAKENKKLEDSVFSWKDFSEALEQTLREKNKENKELKNAIAVMMDLLEDCEKRLIYTDLDGTFTAEELTANRLKNQLRNAIKRYK